jgi:hypothetical protein
MGNRGILHDATGRLRTQGWRIEQSIICVLEFRGRYRKPMAPGAYTQLFFMDEATALAAGHRPCFECRNVDAKAYCAAVERATGKRPTAKEINASIKSEMLPAIRGAERPRADVFTLPEGTMVAVGEDAFLVCERGVRKWSFDGYGPLDAFPSECRRLTPLMSVAALQGGYRPVMAQNSSSP